MIKNKISACSCLVFLALTACADMDATRNDANKIVLNLNVNYLKAYRIVLQSTLNDCNYRIDAVKNSQFNDIKTANITLAENGVVGWTMDFKEVTTDTSVIEFFTFYKAQQKFAYRAQNAINKELKGCVFDETNSI